MSTSSRGRGAPRPPEPPGSAPPAPSPRRRRRRLDADPRSVGGEPPLRVREAGVARLLGEARSSCCCSRAFASAPESAGAARSCAERDRLLPRLLGLEGARARARAPRAAPCGTPPRAGSRAHQLHLPRGERVGRVVARAGGSASSSTKSAFGRIVAAGLRRSHVRRRSSSANVILCGFGSRSGGAAVREHRQTRAAADHAALDETADALERCRRTTRPERTTRGMGKGLRRGIAATATTRRRRDGRRGARRQQLGTRTPLSSHR